MTATDFVAVGVGAGAAEVAAVGFGGSGTPGLATLIMESEVGFVGAWICPSWI